MNYIVIFSFLFNIFLGLYSLKTNYKNKINILFALLAFLNSGVIITNYLIQIRDQPLLWGKLNIFFVIWIPTLFVLGCANLSKRKLIAKENYWLFPSIIFSFSLLTDLLLKDFKLMDSGYVEVFGPLFGIFYSYYVICLLYGLILLLMAYKNASSILEKKKNMTAFIGALIPILTSISTNTYFRIFGNYPEFMSNFLVLPVTNSLMMLLLIYAVIKYGLLKPDISIKEKLDTLRIKILYFVNIISIGVSIIATIILIQIGLSVDYTIVRGFFISLLVIFLINFSINYSLSIYIKKKIVGPIEKISKHASEVGKGNFDVKVGFEGDDEIAVLSRQMDSMTDKLRRTSLIRDNFNKALQIEVQNKTEKLQEAYNQLEDSDKAKKHFIDAIAHELNNPLAVISLSNELINWETITPENKRMLMTIQRNVKRLVSLVKEIEDFALVGQESQKLNIEKFDLKVLINNILQDFTIMADKKRIKFSVNSIGQDFFMEGDKEKITKVFINILENALNFSYEETEVKIKIDEKEDKLEVEVEDQGIGIKEKDIENIFQKFYRAKVEDKLKQGIGLGLPTSLDIVTKHGGMIKAKSEYGKGSKFIVMLPKKHVIL